MKKYFFIITLLLCVLIVSGCSEEINNDLEEISNDLEEAKYVYPESKDVVVTLEEYKQLKSGMTEQEVWDIIGGKCTNTGSTDLGIGEEYITISYGCNGNGNIGSNVVLIFNGGKLYTMSQIGLK